MARLPVVAGDGNAWGTVLNEFLGVAHAADGTLRGTPAGIARETVARETCPTAQAPTAGVGYVMRLEGLAASAYTTVKLLVGTTQGVTLANSFLALYDTTSLARVAVSADVSATIAAATVNTPVDLPLAYTPVTVADHYLMLLIGSAVTMPTFLRGTAFSAQQFASIPPVVASRHNTTGLTATPDPLVLQVAPSGIINFWVQYS